MKTYRIELVNRNSFTVEVPEDQCILNAIEAVGLQLPVKCRIGTCITCAAKLIHGEVEQSRAIALNPDQLEKGYVLLCVASPRGDCQFEVGVDRS
jgi:ferredoxin